MKPATLTASVLLGAVSLLQLLRVVTGTQVTVADHVLPMWPSGVAFLVAGALALLLWRDARD
jgi:hypothetical protein